MIRIGSFFFAMILLLPLELSAQAESQGWIPSGTPPPPSAKSLMKSVTGDVYAITDFDGVYRTQDNGNSWLKVTDPFGPMLNLFTVFVDSTGPFCAFGLPGAYRSTDHGVHWQTVTTRDTLLEDGLMLPDGVILASGLDCDRSVYDSTNPAAASWAGTYISKDAGKSWSRCLSGPGRFRNPLLTLQGTFLAIISSGNGSCICRTSDGGASWSLTTQAYPWITFLARGPDSSILAGAEDRILISRDDGRSWNILGGIWNPLNMSQSAAVDLDGYIITGWTLRDSEGYAGPIQMAISADTGKTWQFVVWQERIVSIYAFLPLSNGRVLAATYAGIYVSSDHGFTWQPVVDDFPGRRVSCFASAPGGKTVYAGTDKGVYRSADDGVHWTKMTFPADLFSATGETRVLNLAVNREGRVAVKLPLTSVITTTDDGKTWSPKAQLDTISTCVAFDTAGSLLEGTFAGTLLRSPDNGLTWLPWGFCPGGSLVTSLHVQPDNTVYATTPLGGVFKSVGGQGAGTAIGLFKKAVQDIIVHPSGTLIAATSYEGIFRSTNGGTAWAPPDSGVPPGSNVCGLALAPSGEILASGSMGVLISTDAGASWHAINEGLPGDTVVSVMITPDGRIIAGTTSGSYWSSTFLEVRDLPGGLPQATSLFQNYPNPFNPSTTIRYILSRRLHVTLAVFNTLGQQVARLVDADESAGTHEVRFNAANLASGLYFYQLRAGTSTETKSFLLLR